MSVYFALEYVLPVTCPDQTQHDLLTNGYQESIFGYQYISWWVYPSRQDAHFILVHAEDHLEALKYRMTKTHVMNARIQMTLF